VGRRSRCRSAAPDLGRGAPSYGVGGLGPSVLKNWRYLCRASARRPHRARERPWPAISVAPRRPGELPGRGFRDKCFEKLEIPHCQAGALVGLECSRKLKQAFLRCTYETPD
jgi:hypothetical protein